MPSIDALWEQAAVVAVLGIWLYSGHKGWWYWSPGVRALLKQVSKERDDWRALAVTLLREKGVSLPPGFEAPRPAVLLDNPGKPTTGRRR